MRLVIRFLIFLGLFFSIDISAQDQIEYLNGDKKYVDKITDVKHDTLSYSHFKKNKKIPLTEIKGYYITINTKENLKKGYYRRNRDYFSVDSSYHEAYYRNDKKTRDYFNDYINSILPKDFSTVKYEKGFFVTNNLDTVKTLISNFKDSKKNNVIIIVKNDTLDFKIYSALQIKSYKVGDIYYESLITKDIENNKSYLFMEKKIAGKLNLFYKPSVPYSSGSLYLLNFSNSNELIPISISSGDSYTLFLDNYIFEVQNDTYNSGYIIKTYTQYGQSAKFKDWMPNLLQDCPKISSRIASEFYTKNDLKMIIKEYNAGCQ